MKKRKYYYIEGKDAANPEQLKYIERDIECDDTFEGDLVMMAFPIGLMKEISSVLSHFNLRNDAEFFYSECREVVSVPEKHVNEKGEGKLTFQSYFHHFPESVQNFFDDAIIVVILHPQDSTGANGNRDYNMIGYIHANHIDFTSPDGQVHKGYYYNVLRLSERTVNGQPIYRRKRIFTTMFSILLDIVTLNDIHFVYASMGRENQAINDALKMNSERHGKFFETFPMHNNTHINLIIGNNSYAEKLVDISNDEAALKEYYRLSQQQRSKFVFNQLHTEANFRSMVNRILSSSPSSRIYALKDANGKIEAAGFFINWGDYMHLKLQNPKGIFKLIDAIKITDKILYPTLLVGDDPASVKRMIKGAAYIYRKEHKVQVTVLNALEGDPYFDIKKSIVYDPFVYFVIYDRPETYEAMKEHSKDDKNNIRIFIDTPML
ncbi:MAG TPA: hypothetical protein VG603_00100 [Chitinophagales bacterium]|nr:hypothetical protein [Chitinophagales bacterium]